MDTVDTQEEISTTRKWLKQRFHDFLEEPTADNVQWLHRLTDYYYLLLGEPGPEEQPVVEGGIEIPELMTAPPDSLITAESMVAVKVEMETLMSQFVAVPSHARMDSMLNLMQSFRRHRELGRAYLLRK